MTFLLPSSGEQQLSLQAILDMNYAFARTAILVASVPLRLFTQLAHQTLAPLELAACADTGPPALTVDLSMLVTPAQGRIRTVSGVAGGWLTESGLRDVQRFHVAAPFPTVIARKAEGVSCAASLFLD